MATRENRWIYLSMLALTACSHLPIIGGSSPSKSPPEARRSDVSSAPIEEGGSSDDPAGADGDGEECSGIKDRRTDVDFNDILRDDGEVYPNVRARRHALILESKHSDFVAATSDVTENDIGSGSVHEENPDLLLKKGEPLLQLACSTRYGTHDVMTIGLRYVRNVPKTFIDPKPSSFALPDEPTLWTFDPHLAYVAATREDLAAVPGAEDSAKLEEQCDEEAIDACAAASSKVKAEQWRADTDERADRACEVAKDRARNKCMGSAAGKKWEQNAKKLDDLRRKRELDGFHSLKAKFAKQ